MDREDREKLIEDAAYKVLIEKGFKGTSMLAVARAAKASNETMYNWYGDKVGLFSAMIARNARTVESELTAVRAQGGRGAQALIPVGHALLAMLVSDRAIALNRAAAADQTGQLGQALAQGGRARIVPLIGGVIGEALDDGADVAEAAETFVFLLVGDVQIRRAIGVLPALSAEEVTARTQRAVTQFKTLFDVT